MPRKPAAYMHDVLQAIERIQTFVSDHSFEDYERNLLLQSAVERQFEIMGEALNQLSNVSPDLVEKIPEYQRIIAFRNILIHGYAEVDSAIVWGVIESKLESLRESVAELLGRQPPP